MLTVFFILAILALLTCVAALAGRCPLGVPVLLLCIYVLLMQVEKGHS